MPDDARNIAEMHERLRASGGFLADERRGLIEVTGPDRGDWLHNLVTNVVRTLGPGQGCYAFALNAQGRTRFDLNVLALDDCLWLDVDARQVAAALAHLGRYIIVERVQLRDVTADWRRFLVLGSATPAWVGSLGLAPDLAEWAALRHTTGQLAGHRVRLLRHDLGPIRGVEMYVPAAAGESVASALAVTAEAAGLVRISSALLDLLHMEVGVPRSVEDIDDEVIPPETGQAARGISYTKGCYLGQEVIERMRSRGVQARQFVGLRVAGAELPPSRAALLAAGRQLGRVTGSCRSVALGGILAVGYLKTQLVPADGAVQVVLDDVAGDGSPIRDYSTASFPPLRTAEGRKVDLPLAAWCAGAYTKKVSG